MGICCRLYRLSCFIIALRIFRIATTHDIFTFKLSSINCKMCNIIFVLYFFFLISANVITIDVNYSDTIATVLPVLFTASESFRLLTLFLVSFQFIQKLISYALGSNIIHQVFMNYKMLIWLPN